MSFSNGVSSGTKSFLANALGVLRMPGEMVQAASKAAFGVVAQADDRFESSGIGANAIGHFLGGAGLAAAAMPLGVFNIVGAVFDGNAEKTAYTMATHPGMVLRQVAEQPPMIISAFIHHPAHVLGAAMVFTTGIGAVEGPGLLDAELASAGPMAKIGNVLDKGGLGHHAAHGVQWVGARIRGKGEPTGVLARAAKPGRVVLGTVVDKTGQGTDWIMGNTKARWVTPLFAFGRKQVADSLEPAGNG
jgi:hypothetical protein